MADFTRFISYLYDYRAGERNRNLGFAKVEARQGMCRIGVNLNHGQVLAQNMILYGYVAEKTDDLDREKRDDRTASVEGNREDWLADARSWDGRFSNGEGGIWLVPLGEMERGSRERRWSFPLERLYSKGIALENLSGLILLSKDRENFLLSVWVDGPWRAEDIRQGELWESRREREEVVAENRNESNRKFTGDRSRAEQLTIPETAQEAQINVPTDAGNKKTDYLDTSPRPLQDERDLELEMQDQNHTRYQNDAENDQIAENNRIAENGMLAEDNTRPERSQPPLLRSEPSRPARQDTSSAPDSWRGLCKLFPAARPFEPSAWEVLCISLQDIGRLPPENWVWGNNHFLLHGFYQYHHLILARQRNENKVYLGIPGEFGTNEKFMAGMFGLHQFQRERQGKSDKGYWLTPIRL